MLLYWRAQVGSQCRDLAALLLLLLLLLLPMLRRLLLHGSSVLLLLLPLPQGPHRRHATRATGQWSVDEGDRLLR